MPRTSRPIEIPPTEWTHPYEYAVVGKKRGKLVWFCGDRRRRAYDKPVWTAGKGGWAQVVHKLSAIKKILKAAQEHSESIDVKQIAIVKLTTTSKQTAEIVSSLL